MLFFFNDTATTEIYTLSLHDALPISGELLEANAEEIKGWLSRESGAIGPFGDFQVHTSAAECYEAAALPSHPYGELLRTGAPRDRKSTRLNSSHANISYAVFCLKKKT